MSSILDQTRYPYLTDDMDIVPVGTRRQRPVGRYKQEELERRLTEEISGEITAEQERLENVQAIRERPAEAEAVLDESVKEHVTEEFGTWIGIGRNMLRDTTDTELREALTAVENRYDNGRNGF